VEIAGHTDIRGSDGFNMNLSQRRAQSVVNYLASHFQVQRERLHPVGYGERVPLCSTQSTEACHSLNRRVEVVSRTMAREGPRTRGLGDTVDFRARSGSKIAMELGFFRRKGGSNQVELLLEDGSLRSRSDGYFLFFRPEQDCFVYVLQQDSSGKTVLLTPSMGGSGAVKAGGDYWLPGFGKAYTLDDTKGQEILYILATAEPLDFASIDLPLSQQVRGAVNSLRTRSIRVIPPGASMDSAPQEALQADKARLQGFLEKTEGTSGWVRIFAFQHD
jgi:hypothetical protein